MNLSEKIIALRNEHKMSQGDLADKLNVSRQAVSKWETGQSTPDLDRIVAMSDLFGVTTDSLIKGEETSSTDQPTQQCVRIPSKLYIIDINKRRLSTFEEFLIEMLGIGNTGEATVISGLTTPITKARIPVCALYGISKGILGISKRTLLGFYASVEDAKRELGSISKASETQTVYELKYAAKMNGVRIAED